VEIRTTAGQAMMLSVVTFEPGSIVPEHQHPHEQMGVLISGRAEFTVGGITRILGPGDLWRIPGGVPHRVVALDGPVVAVDVLHPTREDYL
jgi:quercetin dioxygenase-like cupin family protein